MILAPDAPVLAVRQLAPTTDARVIARSAVRAGILADELAAAAIATVRELPFRARERAPARVEAVLALQVRRRPP